MKRLVIIAATLFALSGIVYAGGGDYEIQPQEQRSWSKTFIEPQQLIKPEYKWTPRDFAAVAGVFVSAVGVAGGLYLNNRRKKKE
jgi:hypothetical protein